MMAGLTYSNDSHSHSHSDSDCSTEPFLTDRIPPCPVIFLSNCFSHLLRLITLIFRAVLFSTFDSLLGQRRTPKRRGEAVAVTRNASADDHRLEANGYELLCE